MRYNKYKYGGPTEIYDDACYRLCILVVLMFWHEQVLTVSAIYKTVADWHVVSPACIPN